MFNQIKLHQLTTLKVKLIISLLVILALISLACSLGGLSEEMSRKVIHIKKTLPTLTPTGVAGPPQDEAVAEEPGLLAAEGSALPQEPIVETTPLMPSVTSIAVAQGDTQPVTPPVSTVATLTPTLLSSTPLAPSPTETVEPPSPTLPPAPSPTSEPVTPPNQDPTPSPGGWSFIGIQAAYDQEEEGVIMHGDIINNTGTPQVISYLTGTLFDDQAQITARVDDAAIYWPVAIVPPGGQVPFELITYDIQNIADFNLSVISEPSSDTPRQDFEFSELNPSTKAEYYCVRGKLWNQGSVLLDHLLILAVLYDDQDNIINFGTFEDYSPENVLGDKALPFEVCTNSYNHQVVRHELRAVGL